MAQKATANETTATTIGVNSPEHSWGVFCFNDLGDLFLNSDWGAFMYAWRSFGPGWFREFLSSLNADYMTQKLWMNVRAETGKKMPPHKEENVKALCALFIQHLKDHGKK